VYEKEGGRTYLKPTFSGTLGGKELGQVENQSASYHLSGKEADSGMRGSSRKKRSAGD